MSRSTPFLLAAALAAFGCTPTTPAIDAGGGLTNDAGNAGNGGGDEGDGTTCDAAKAADTGTLSDTSVGAGDDYAPSCGATGAEDFVYEITLTEASGVRLTVNGFDAVLVLMNDTCTFDEEGTNELGCVDSGYEDDPETLAFEVLEAGTYYVVIDGYEGAAGDFTLDVEIQAGGICVGDAFDGEGDEDNDVPARAPGAGAGDFTTGDDPTTADNDALPLVLCEGDTDVFSFGHMGGQLDVTVDGADAVLNVATVDVDVEGQAVEITGAGAEVPLSGVAARGYYVLTITKADVGPLGAPYSFAIDHACEGDGSDDPDLQIDKALDDRGALLEPLAEPDERMICATDTDTFLVNNIVAGDVVFTLAGGANLGVTLTKVEGTARTALAAPGDYTTNVAGADLTVTIPTAAVGKYELVVDAGDAAATVDYTFNVALAGVATPPANDACAGHAALTPAEAPTPTFGRTIKAVDQYDSPCNGDDQAEPGAGAPEVFYSFNLAAPTSVGITFDGTATDFNGAVSLLRFPGNTCPTDLSTLTQVELLSTPLCKTGDKLELQAPDLAAGDYLVVVDGTYLNFFGLFEFITKGGFDVAVKTYPAGLPDPASCAAPEAIMLPAVGAESTITLSYADASDNARDFYGEACSPYNGGAGDEKVYTFTPSANAALTISTEGYDTLVALLANDCGGFSFVACNDDASDETFSSSITANVVAGTPYFLVVDSWPVSADDEEQTTTITIAAAAP